MASEISKGYAFKGKTLVGKTFGKLEVIGFSHRVRTDCGGLLYHWICRCECGNQTVVTNRNLTSGHTLSCGCLVGKPIRHGFAKKGQVHKFHMVWRNILARCLNPKSPSFDRYGGRGISVCERWLTFENFRDDMFSGWKDGLTVERKDNNGNYEPDNCVWATRIEQALNRRSNVRITALSKTLTASEWSNESGISASLIIWRVRNGWSPEDAITERPRVRG